MSERVAETRVFGFRNSPDLVFHRHCLEEVLEHQEEDDRRVACHVEVDSLPIDHEVGAVEAYSHAVVVGIPGAFGREDTVSKVDR